MGDIAALLERVRAATGPDRELDLELLARVQQRGQWSDNDIFYGLTDVEGTTAPPAYTASVDVALALVERKLPGFSIRLQTPDPTVSPRNPTVMAGAELLPHLHNDDAWRIGQRSAVAPTLPLAIIAALLTSLKDSSHE